MPPPPLFLSLLGPFEVQIEGTPLPPLRSRKGLGLLALLALRHGREIRREAIAETLWPESQPDQGLASLRQSLSDLRKAMADASWRLQSPTSRALTLDLGGAEVDLLAFDSAILRADFASLRVALDLYRGPLLEGWTDEWLLHDREERQQSFLKAAHKLALDALSAGDFPEAVSLLRRAAAADPLRQYLHRELMRALLRAGDGTAALQVFSDLRQRLRDQYDSEPDLETIQLYRSIRSRRRPPLPDSAVRQTPETTVLPRPVSSLVGREKQLRAIDAALLTGRLVTLTGVGGVGKTSLAVEAARSCVGARSDPDGADRGYLDSAWFIDLAPLTDSALVVMEVAKVLNVHAATPATDSDTRTVAVIGALVDFLRSRQALLVLDNCEHLLAACCQLCHELLSKCNGLRILATSRERLGVQGETVCAVPTLGLPDLKGSMHIEAVRASAAVQLFLQRAAEVRSDFSLTPQNAATIARLCDRVDGIPLAIELVAPMVDSLTAAEIESHLQNRFHLPGVPAGTRPARHQTLHTVIDWSYELLSAPERTLFRRLSLFWGGWNREAAENILSNASLPSSGGRKSTGFEPEFIAGPQPPILGAMNSGSFNPSCTGPAGHSIRAGEVALLLSRLVAKSLVLAEERHGAMRYRMLEIVRQYALDRLNEEDGSRDELRAAEQRHALFYLALAEAAEPQLTGPDQIVWLQRIEMDHDNLRAIFNRAVSKDVDAAIAPRLAAALGRFWQIRGYVSEGRDRLRVALALSPEPDQCRASASNWAGILAIYQGDYGSARDSFEEALSISRNVGYKQGIAASLGCLGILSKDEGDLNTARCFFEESLTLARDAADRVGLAGSLGYLGIIAASQGDCAAARSLYEESLSIRHLLGDRWGVAASLNNLGLLARQEKDFPRARTLLEESLSIRRELGDRRSMAITLNNLGSVALAKGDFSGAREKFGESLSLCFNIGEKRSIAYGLESFARLAMEQGQRKRAARLYGAAESLRESIQSPLPDNERVVHEPGITTAKLEASSSFDADWTIGREWTMETAVGVALEKEVGS